MEALKAMSPQQRIQWALAQGQDGIARLLMFQEMQLQEQLQQVQQQAQVQSREQVLENILAEWAEQNSDILNDPKWSRLAEGIDMVLLRDGGFSSYKELTPAQLKAHLAKVRQVIDTFKGEVKGNEEGVKEGPEGEAQNEPPVHIGDLGGGQGAAEGGAGLAPEALAQLAENDPLKFEEIVSKLPDDKLASLLDRIGA
jgi:hypothetical protein